VFDEIGEIAKSAKEKIENGEWQSLGALMDANHALLQRLTVSSPELDHLTDVARQSGADGAKLSGGGRGGNLIALVSSDKAAHIAEALLSAGAKRTIVTTVESLMRSLLDSLEHFSDDFMEDRKQPPLQER
jgi:mevalonate kinase